MLSRAIRPISSAHAWFIARGIIGERGDNAACMGRFTFAARAGGDWFQWDGAHKARHFGTLGKALSAARFLNDDWIARGVHAVQKRALRLVGTPTQL